MNNGHVHNFNEYLCKLNARKKYIWNSTFYLRQNTNDRKITGISAFGALVASRFSKNTSLDTKTETCLSSFYATKQDTSCHSKLYHELQLNTEWRWFTGD
jgi:hypothetical protein